MQKHKHDIRVFIREAFCRHIAHSCAKDYRGLEAGLTEDPIVRKAVFAHTHMHSGPSLMSAGMWTGARLFKAGLADSHNCTRCGGDWETVNHRLWTCPANRQDLQALQQNLHFSGDVDSLLQQMPPSFQRCALPPKDSRLHREDQVKIIHYMQHAASEGTIARARHYRELNPKARSPVDFGDTPDLLRANACVRRSQTGEKIIKRRRSAELAPEELHPSHIGVPGTDRGLPNDGSGMCIFTDGSAYKDQDTELPRSGWGFVAVNNNQVQVEAHRPCQLDQTAADYIGAQRHSNTVGELSALYHAATWALQHAGGSCVTFYVDSMVALRAAQGAWRLKSNKTLAQTVRNRFRLLENMCNISMRWIKAHKGNHWNEKADELARHGADGLDQDY